MGELAPSFFQLKDASFQRVKNILLPLGLLILLQNNLGFLHRLVVIVLAFQKLCVFLLRITSLLGLRIILIPVVIVPSAMTRLVVFMIHGRLGIPNRS